MTLLSTLKFSIDQLLSMPRTSISFKDIHQGDLILIVDEIGEPPNSIYFFEDIRSDSNSPESLFAYMYWYISPDFPSWHLMSRSNGLQLFDDGEQYFRIHVDAPKSAVDPNRKDFCHDCQSDKMIWKMMSGHCALCGKHLIG